MVDFELLQIYLNSVALFIFFLRFHLLQGGCWYVSSRFLRKDQGWDRTFMDRAEEAWKR